MNEEEGLKFKTKKNISKEKEKMTSSYKNWKRKMKKWIGCISIIKIFLMMLRKWKAFTKVQIKEWWRDYQNSWREYFQDNWKGNFYDG